MKMTPTICYNTSEPMFGKSGAMSPKVTSCSFRSIAKCVVAVALTLTGLGAFAVIEDFTYDYATCTADLSEGQEWRLPYEKLTRTLDSSGTQVKVHTKAIAIKVTVPPDRPLKIITSGTRSYNGHLVIDLFDEKPTALNVHPLIYGQGSPIFCFPDPVTNDIPFYASITHPYGRSYWVRIYYYQYQGSGSSEISIVIRCPFLNEDIQDAQYRVNVDNGGLGDRTSSLTYRSGSVQQEFPIDEPKYSGYYISSWMVTTGWSGGDSPSVRSGSSGSTLIVPPGVFGDFSIVPRWEKKVSGLEVSVDPDGSAPYIFTYSKKSSVQRIAIRQPQKAAFDIVAWNIIGPSFKHTWEDEFNGESYAGPYVEDGTLVIPPDFAEEFRLVPVWKGREYTVTVVDESGNVTGTTHYRASTGKSYATIPVPERSGCVVSKWTIGTGYNGSDAPVASGALLTVPAGTYGSFSLRPVWSQDTSSGDFTIEDGVLTKYNGAGGFVTIPSSVKVIGASAFMLKTKVTSVAIPSSVTVIEDSAFYMCSFHAVSLPPTLKEIKRLAFYWCPLYSIDLPESLESIGSAAFRLACERSLFIPRGVKDIAERAFNENDRLEEITVDAQNQNYTAKDGLLYTKDGKTLICCPTRLARKKVVLPDGVSEILEEAFYGCTEVASVVVQEGLKVLASRAFNECTNLYSVVYYGDAPSTGAETYKNAPQGLTTYVRRDSTGWAGAGSTGLPDKWPMGDARGQRLIAYLSESVISFSPGAFADGVETQLFKPDGYALVLPTAKFTRTGFIQSGWSVSEDGSTKDFDLSGKLFENGARQLYPYWSPIHYVVRFHSNSDSPQLMSDQQFEYGIRQRLSANVFKNGNREFLGWAVKQNGGVTYGDRQMVGDLTSTENGCVDLFAVWGEEPTRADLRFFTPSGWPRAVFVTPTIGTYYTGHAFRPTDPLCVYYAIRNMGEGEVSNIVVKLQLAGEDGIVVSKKVTVTHCTTSSLSPGVGFTQALTWDVNNSVPSGNYMLTVSIDPENVLGNVSIANANYVNHFAIVNPSLTFTDAFDSRASNVSIAGTVIVQTNVVYSGNAAVQFGPSDNFGASRFSLAYLGPGNLSFRFKAKGDGVAYLSCGMDGNQLAEIGCSGSWCRSSCSVPAGEHIISFSFADEGSDSVAFHEGFLDDVIWTPTAISIPGSSARVTSAWVTEDLERRFGVGKARQFLNLFGSDLAVALAKPSGKLDASGVQMSVWQDYVAGTDPTDPNDKFKVTGIKLDNGELKVSWHPDLNENGTRNVRLYTEYGCKELGDSWEDMKTVRADPEKDPKAYRFRKVTVDMPQ